MSLRTITVLLAVTTLALLAGVWLGTREFAATWLATFQSQPLVSPLIPEDKRIKPRPLLAYTIPALKEREYQASEIQIVEELEDTPDHTAYLFTYQTMGQTMSGRLTVPKPLPAASSTNPQPVIVMLRGWAPAENYVPGLGTIPAGNYLASQGFVTIAPDFFGYGQSDPEPSDSWESRFIKPINVVELIKTLENSGVPLAAADAPDSPAPTLSANSLIIGLWAHSNGGQIALTTLEVLEKPIPTTLWAPVTAPFPYSVLYFGDEVEDEGKAQRKWISLFEEDYDVFEFSHTQHLHLLPNDLKLQIHHGTSDDAALKWWSDEFVAKLDTENQRRVDEYQLAATQSASLTKPTGIDTTYFVYPGADHNLRPAWQTVVERDVAFFAEHLTSEK